MDYVRWPEGGCVLADARERTADRARWHELRGRIEGIKADVCSAFACVEQLEASASRPPAPESALPRAGELETELTADFLFQLTEQRLIAFGHLGHIGAPPQVISPKLWRSLTDIDWENSSAHTGRNGRGFSSIRVFPVLLAPCRVAVIAARPLSEVFRCFVLHDPQVAALAKHAMSLSPHFERVFVHGRCYVHGVDEWPVAFEGRQLGGAVHPDPEKRSILGFGGSPDPIEVVVAVEALIDRYAALIGMLRRGELEAQGMPAAAGYPAAIPRSVWSHDDFSFNTNGDVFVFNDECEDPSRDRLRRRWIAVVLQRPSGPSAPMEASSSDMEVFGFVDREAADEIGASRLLRRLRLVTRYA